MTIIGDDVLNLKQKHKFKNLFLFLILVKTILKLLKKSILFCKTSYDSKTDFQNQRLQSGYSRRFDE